MSLGPVRPVLVALSLANLLLVRIWTELLGERVAPAPSVWCAAALVNLLLLTALIWTVNRWGSVAGRGLLAVASVALVAKEIALAAGHGAAAWKAAAAGVVESGMRRGWLWPVALLALTLLTWVAWRARQVEWTASVLVMLSPIVLVTAGRAGWQALVPPRAPQALMQPVNAAFRPGPRVVWIIFDELDERVAFAQRPAGLHLPALDAFRAESIVFRQAISPANSTVISIPAMLGQIFERPGVRAGLVGWYLPYCQDYGARLASCEAWAMDRQLNSYGTEVWKAVGHQWRSLFESSLYSVFGQSLALEAHARTVVEMEEASARLAARRDLNLVFLHLPTPHSPYIYDPVRRDLSATNQDARGYLGNLELADRVFSRIRASLTASGLWSQTHVLVSGDHGFRQAYKIGYSREDRHVPFMWKPAGEVKPRQLNGRFETGAVGGGTAGLVSRLLEGENAESVLARYP